MIRTGDQDWLVSQLCGICLTGVLVAVQYLICRRKSGSGVEISPVVCAVRRQKAKSWRFGGLPSTAAESAPRTTSLA